MAICLLFIDSYHIFPEQGFMGLSHRYLHVFTVFCAHFHSKITSPWPPLLYLYWLLMSLHRHLWRVQQKLKASRWLSSLMEDVFSKSHGTLVPLNFERAPWLSFGATCSGSPEMAGGQLPGIHSKRQGWNGCLAGTAGAWPSPGSLASCLYLCLYVCMYACM